MLNSKFNWEIVSQEKNVALDEGQLLPTVLDLIQKRGFSDREVFEEGEFHDPFLFSDMQKSVDRIKQAVESEQLILIYGDYDIDGVSATAILVSAIRQLGGNVHYYIPNRFYEGYGPNEEAFLQAIDDGFELIITVDNGVSGIEEAKLLAEHHVDYIVTDHHHLKSELPQALGLLHPEHDATYPFDELCGAGVALKLAQALLGDDVPDEFVMYAMLGTIGDVVPLRHENRTIVKKGLKTLRQTKHFGLNALAKCLDLTLDQATEVTIGFDIGPVINAAGRMDEARYAVDLLLADSIDRAHDIANQLVALNTLRQQETQSVLEMAKEQIEKENKSNQNVLILFNQN